MGASEYLRQPRRLECCESLIAGAMLVLAVWHEQCVDAHVLCWLGGMHIRLWRSSFRTCLRLQSRRDAPRERGTVAPIYDTKESPATRAICAELPVDIRGLATKLCGTLCEYFVDVQICVCISEHLSFRIGRDGMAFASAERLPLPTLRSGEFCITNYVLLLKGPR